MEYNTGETTESLKEKYNPEGSDLRRAQLRILEMLIYLREVCESQGIKWCLEGGNVLGAVRHGGFIPWDDDADVIMERKDYIRFIRYMEKHPHPQFVIQTRKTDKGYYGTWVILRDLKSEYIQDSIKHNIREYRGLQIDIFPIQRGNIRCLSFLSSGLFQLFNCNIGHNTFFDKTFSFMLNDLLFPLFRAVSYCIGNKKYFSYEYGHGHYPKWKYDDVMPTKPLSFEGEIFPGPSNVDAYLKAIFNDYMTLPPEDSRNKHKASCRIWD